MAVVGGEEDVADLAGELQVARDGAALQIVQQNLAVDKVGRSLRDRNASSHGVTRLLWESLRELGGGERFLAGVGFQDVEQFRFDAGRAVNLTGGSDGEPSVGDGG